LTTNNASPDASRPGRRAFGRWLFVRMARARTAGLDVLDLAGLPKPATPHSVGAPGTPESLKAELLPNGSVRLTLAVVGDAPGGVLTLTAAADNGIVAAGDGGAWAGVTDLLLPFP